ncbi:MAG: hypothetical protein ACREAD_03670 [Nitrosopumilaceae archaeon]
MRPTIITIIGVFTIVMAIPSLYMLYKLEFIGMWFSFGTYYQIFYSLALFFYYGMIMIIPALVIGISTLKEKKWTRKANIVFQIVSLPIITGTIVSWVLFSNIHFTFDLFFLEILGRLISLILGGVILYLLFRHGTKTYYQTRPIA